LTFWALSCGVSGVVTRVRAGAVRGSSHDGAKGFLIENVRKTGCRAHPAVLFNWCSGSFPGIKWPKREADHSSLSSAEIMNQWSCTSAPLYVLMA